MMISKAYFLIVFFLMSCQTVPSASVPEADDKPIQIFKTSLQITVRDNLGNIVEGAEVQIFLNKEDYQKEANPVQGIKYTDDKGRVKFSELDTQEYYINVEKGDMNNYGAGIKTDQLTEKRNNKVTIIIE
ncbi:carboxypeptidase regulatory-like domain-containing protein [Porifericola rhodea]|uniref:carboxypeptidase regulatory-like domain-containing protein n=1 Tax=Porifericola rhodea TaxID=930972 RepID=UPI0026668481|nr:carboxypeptidase regulatory-like domain-containing protein [Porifericola rhodea]WKN32765.1 carboxypeptidase regulatory-like domain-containing protein [Porifericola rhodea]